MPDKLQLSAERQAIGIWMRDTTEPYDRWTWDGRTLRVYLRRRLIEKYSRSDLIRARALRNAKNLIHRNHAKKT